MRFTPDFAGAFGDWLERDRIRYALLAARPDLAGAFVLDARRPLLRVLRPQGGAVLAARMEDAEPAPWVVGVTGAAPVLHEAGTTDEVVRLVLELLSPPPADPDGTTPRGRR